MGGPDASLAPPPAGSIGELKWDSGSGTYFGVDPSLDMILLEQTQNERGRITPAFKKLVYDAFSQDSNKNKCINPAAPSRTCLRA